MFDEFGGLVHLEVHPQPGQVHGDSLDRVRPGLEQARPVVDRLQDSSRGRDPLRESFQRRMKRDSCPHRIGHLGQRLRNEFREIALGGLARFEPGGGFRFPVDAVDANVTLGEICNVLREVFGTYRSKEVVA